MVEHIKAGKLRALAVTGVTRSPQLPEVPTLIESGVAGYSAYVWMGLLAPKGTPPAIVERLHRELKASLADARGQGLHGRGRHRDRRLDTGRVRRVLPRGARPLGEGRHAKPARRSTEAASRPPRGTAGDRQATAATLARPRTSSDCSVDGVEHWTTKKTADGDVRLFLWEKFVGSPDGKPAVLFVHGSSMASQPTFDLTRARPARFVGDGLVRASAASSAGASTWKATAAAARRATSTATSPTAPTTSRPRPTTSSPARGVRSFLAYGISSGALRAALFAQRHPERVARLALDAFVWTGEGAPTLAQRRKKLPEFLATKRRPIDRAFVHSIFARDHPDCAERRAVDAFADAILALDDSMPNGTYIDMCSKLPVVDPAQITVPTLVLRGQYDGIAAFDDLIEFFKRLPQPDKQFTVMAGISHASFQQKNYLMVYHILHAYFTQPAPVYTDPTAH